MRKFEFVTIRSPSQMLQSLNYKYSPGEKVVMFLVYTWIWHISCKLTGSIMSGEYSVRI